MKKDFKIHAKSFINNSDTLNGEVSFYNLA